MRKPRTFLLAILAVGILAAAGFQLTSGDDPQPSATAPAAHRVVKLWEPLTSPRYNQLERMALIANVVVAIAGLVYALMLVSQVKNAPQGTPRMQEIARAIREGANAYLYRQFRVVGLLIIVITA